MSVYHEQLVKDYDKIRRRLRSDDISEDIAAWVSGHLQRIQPDLDLVLRGDDGYKDFLLAFVQREVERARPLDFYPSIDDSPYTSVRDAPICTCTYRGCDLKDGRLPGEIRSATDTFRGIRAFQQVHRGLPVVLVGWPTGTGTGDDTGAADGSDTGEVGVEVDVVGAREAWSRKRAVVQRYGIILQAHLRGNATVPDPDPLDPETDADVAAAARELAAPARGLRP